MLDISIQSAQPFAVFGVAFVISALGLLMYLRLPKRHLIWDLPNRPNAMHTNPTPRIGGLVMATAVVAAVLTLSGASLPKMLVIAAFMLLVVSIFDDRWQLSPALRMAIHLAAALLMTWFWIHSFASLHQAEGAWKWALTPIGAVIVVLAITWMTNLYNFMDGADGMAGGMAIFGFGSYALVAYNTQGSTDITLLSAALAGAAAGFLLFNFSPAKVFMGDAGSIPLGFLAAILGIQGSLVGAWHWWFPLVVFSPFIVDATVTLLKRLWVRKKIWLAHRDHYYQRLILAGWSHRRTALTYYLIMLGTSTSAIIAQSGGFEVPGIGIESVILVTWVVIYALLLCWSEWRFKQTIKMKSKKTVGIS